MLETSVKAQTLLLLLLAATPNLVVCEVEVFNQGDGLLFQQVDGIGQVCGAVFIAQRLLTRVAR